MTSGTWKNCLFCTHGWTKRNDPERCYPAGSVNDKGFIRAWVELHSSADLHCSGRIRKTSPRLRIYGNKSLMATMNEIIYKNTKIVRGGACSFLNKQKYLNNFDEKESLVYFC